MQSDAEPILDTAHFGHVELFTPKPAESLWFFTHVLSLEEVERAGQAWGAPTVASFHYGTPVVYAKDVEHP